VSPLKKARKPQGWRHQFDLAYSEGRFADAAAIFASAGATSRSDILLRAARAYMHADPAAALSLLLKLRVPTGASPQQIERDALLTEAFARTRDFESADERLTVALRSATELEDRDLLAFVGYRGVRRYLLAEDPAKAREYLKYTRAGKTPEAALYSSYSEAIILGYEERVREQAQRLLELLRSLDPNSTAFMEVRAWSTHTLAGLARELYLPDAVSELDRQLSGYPWSKDFSPNRFQTLRSLAWAKALQGDYFNAFRHLKAASESASTDAWRAVAACDRASLARYFDEHRWSRVELDEAEQLAGRVEWHATRAEERMGLLSLAELFSTIDTARSAMYLARYRELGDMKSPLYYGHDARREAYEKYSTGVIEIALGNAKRGLSQLRDARAVFERFGYDFRVARCLIAEFRLTNDRNALPLIEEKLRNYPRSWLVKEFREISGPLSVALPPMQKRVFEELCRGKTTAEISSLLGRSQYTVSNHIKAIFKTFGVKSRSALLAEAVRRGYIRHDGEGPSTQL